MTLAVELVVPGALNQQTGGYLYDRRMLEGLAAQGHCIRVHELPGRFPDADDEACAGARAAIARFEGLPVIDGLALPAFAPWALELPRPWVAQVHHPLPLETGLTGQERDRYRAIEAALLPEAARILVTSPATVHDLAAYALAPERVGVVVPGTDPAPLAAGSGGDGVVLLKVGTLTPRKGHALLIEALAPLRGRPWRLVCCGSETRDPATAQAVRGAVARANLTDQVQFMGELESAGLAEAYARADVVVSASYHEGYGMALAEGLARGLPVIASAGGAVAQTVPEGAGLLVPPGDASALRAALGRFLDEPDLRAVLRAGAAAARQALPTWSEQAAQFSDELTRVTTS